MGYLINRVGKLLVKRAFVGLIVLVGANLADGARPLGDIIGLVVVMGIAIWSIYGVIKNIKDNVDRFRSRIWRQFKRLPRQLLDDSLIECLDRKPECCKIFQQEVNNLLVQWVKKLKPGWKKSDPISASLQWREMQRDIKRSITDRLRECCTRPEDSEYEQAKQQ